MSNTRYVCVGQSGVCVRSSRPLPLEAWTIATQPAPGKVQFRVSDTCSADKRVSYSRIRGQVCVAHVSETQEMISSSSLGNTDDREAASA